MANYKNRPTISVIMPVYNTVPDYLRDAIDSILGQTFTDFEFIIVNDGSTDERVEKVIKSYKDKRIRYVYKENSGITKTLLHGVDMARGEFIARMDSDDISLPERFATQVDFLRRHPDVSLVGAWVDVFPTHDRWKYIERPKFLDFMIGNHVAHPVVMWRRADFEKYGLRYDDRCPVAQDYELWSRVVRVLKIANVPQVLLRYRFDKHNVSVTRATEQCAIAAMVRQNMINFLTSDLCIQSKLQEMFSAPPQPQTGWIPYWLGRLILCLIPSHDARHNFRIKYIKPRVEK